MATDTSFELGQLTDSGATPASAPAHLTWAAYGRVALAADQGCEYLGASAHTNNTGELSALYHALERAGGRRRGVGREIVHSDSLYAINMATGKWMPHKGRNKVIVAELRARWRRLQKQRPREVSLRHVRSHVQIPGNELADWLADKGAEGTLDDPARPLQSGQHVTQQATRWLREWMEAHGARRGGDDGRGGTASSSSLLQPYGDG